MGSRRNLNEYKIDIQSVIVYINTGIVEKPRLEVSYVWAVYLELQIRDTQDGYWAASIY